MYRKKVSYCVFYGGKTENVKCVLDIIFVLHRMINVISFIIYLVILYFGHFISSHLSIKKNLQQLIFAPQFFRHFTNKSIINKQKIILGL